MFEVQSLVLPWIGSTQLLLAHHMLDQIGMSQAELSRSKLLKQH
jgi:hypothetical protein